MVSNSGQLLSSPSIPTEATSAAANAWGRGLLMVKSKDAYPTTLLLSGRTPGATGNGGLQFEF
jgi:hypothetical protein